jgi:hypothetical protein
MLSPSGWPEVPCARCERRVPGLQWGELCPGCLAERRRRASRLSRRISLPATLLVALYVMLRMPPYPLSRIYGAIAVLATYIVLRRIVTRMATELLPK